MHITRSANGNHGNRVPYKYCNKIRSDNRLHMPKRRSPSQQLLWDYRKTLCM